MEIMFNPKNVAIVGATGKFMKVGGFVAMNVQNCGFIKNAYAINPNPKYQNKKIN